MRPFMESVFLAYLVMLPPFLVIEAEVVNHVISNLGYQFDCSAATYA